VRWSMMKRLIAAVLLFALLQDARDLKLSLPKEKPLRIRLTSLEEADSTPRGSTDKDVNRGGCELGLEAQGLSGADRFAVKVTMLRIHREIIFQINGQKDGRKMDSATPGADNESERMGNLVGLSLLFDVAPEGKILETRGAAEMEAEFIRKLGVKQEDEGPQRKMMATFVVPVLRENVDRLLALYPPNAVGIGATWSRKYSIGLSSGFPHHGEVAWTLKSRKESRIQLSGKWTHTPYADADQLGRELKIVSKLTGTGEGTAELDDETGWPLKASVTHQLNGSTSVEGLKAPSLGDTVDSTLKITLTVGPWDGK
jgi:hypothetical protein